MTDLGLLMADPLAQACAEGRKTVTRRPMSPQPPAEATRVFQHGPVWMATKPAEVLGGEGGRVVGWPETRIPGAGTATIGQRVWVRECFADICAQADPYCWCDKGNRTHHSVEYRAVTGNPRPGAWPDNNDPDCENAPTWKPSIHMPKWAARTWGTLTSVTPCDLSDIDDAEAQIEGFDTAAEFLRVLGELYPGVRWFWRLGIEWDAKGGDHG